MFLIKKTKAILGTLALLLAGLTSYGQLDGGNAYMVADGVNVAIDGPKGKEGTGMSTLFNFRGGSGGTPCGFVSDPDATGWDPLLFNGDYFTPGAPENGWGLEFGGMTYNNNAGFADFDIMPDPLKPISHTVDGSCVTVEWEGAVDGVIVNIKYHLSVDALFYTTEVTLINNSGADIIDLYYHRNVDPDNNQPIGGTFTTTNTIVSQPSGTCQKALVSAEQFLPHDSYLGFGALGDKFRVSHGGFANRDASDIWNGVGGLTGTVGAVAVMDQAISIAYKCDLLDTDTANFTYAIVLSEDAVEEAFSSLYYIDFSSIGGSGGGLINQCNPTVDTATSCNGVPVTLSVDGPNAGDYTWTWESEPIDTDFDSTGPVTEVSPGETTTYTVTGDPISECLVNSISKTIIVEFSEGPDISITDPGPFCEEFDITTLEFSDLNSTVDPNIVFLTECPDSASQIAPEFVGPTMGPDDEVWLLIGDTAGGCFDKQQVIIDFGGLGAAGVDSTIMLCGTDGTLLDLHDLIEEGANPLGDFDETTFSGQFTESTGILDVSGLSGTFTFTYSVDGVGACPPDEATFTVVVFGQPEADFEYEVDGNSSADGLASTCIINTVDFVNESTVPGGSTITSYDWDFGDGTGSSTENPSHTYTDVDTYTITLTVTTADGCTSTFTKEIIIYTEPILDIIFNDPTCNGFTDGSITAFVAGGSGSFDIEIEDEGGTILNVPGSNTANTLGAGIYTITVVDPSGCDATGTIILTDPPALDVFFRVDDPLCYDDFGCIVIDSVTGEGINNPISYFWAPVTNVMNGLDADSVKVLGGTYTLTVNDSKGCSNVIDITVDRPDSLFFNGDTGFDPAFCRVFDFQNGNGQVFASASGGTPDYTYLWTDLSDPTSTTTNTTWGGRNPGDYLIVATDANGCTIERTVTVDSLNPVASFTTVSDDLNSDCQGVGPVEVEFCNTSINFANPLNPLADTTFFWNLDCPNGTWQISEDINEKFDTLFPLKDVTYTVDVALVATNKNGCTDTTKKTITIFADPVIPPLNIFTPNGDGNNDLFSFGFQAIGIAEFNCVIVNRWGVRVAELTSIVDTWDGTDLNGSPLNDGVYFYAYEAMSDNSLRFEGQGTVTIAGAE